MFGKAIIKNGFDEWFVKNKDKVRVSGKVFTLQSGDTVDIISMNTDGTVKICDDNSFIFNMPLEWLFIVG